MKRIELEDLRFRNFKGARDFALKAGAEDTDVFGDNATGKTTLNDGWHWLLFDKDSQNKSKFSIKTIGKDGNELHQLEHEVEGVLIVNGRRRTLRKVHKETWTKKRGSATSDFTGHTTDYHVDGVPVKKGEYESEVAAIIDEDTFKLLTNPNYFNEHLDKKKRRDVLLTVCGDISDGDVIAGNQALAALPDILGDRTIENHQKWLASRKSELNKEISTIPVRIDEVYRSMPDTDGMNEQQLTARLEKAKAAVSSKEAELSRVQNGGEVTVKENRLREIEGELQQIKNDVQADSLRAVADMRRVAADKRRKVEDADYDIRSAERRIQGIDQEITDHSNNYQRMLGMWKTVDAERFLLEHHDESCAACGQALPAEKVKAAHDKAEANFNRSRSERLEEYKAKGVASKNEAERLKAERDRLDKELEGLREVRTGLRKAADAADAEVQALQAAVQDVNDDPAYIAKQEEVRAVREEIQRLRSEVQQAVEQTRTELAGLREAAAAVERDISKLDMVKSANERIEQLKQQEKTLAAEYERLEHEDYLAAEFIKTKVSMLESKINSKFKLARFRLFESQINGGIKEDCETLYEGVPYSSGLNNAGRINVGLDIINTLSEHYGVTAPIFIDNAEAVTKLIATHGQKIRLIVPPAFDNLPAEARSHLISQNGGTYEKAAAAWKQQNSKLRVERAKNARKEAV
ncbi:AAA family ATPase [Paenibacillus daejeonensis]|uniref:AAA family ATPase n=1 Tax=Paenibacillus daejeonensis TaxID=135193 RepID=UPI00036DAB7B|nr:AAA family ATPase [Paenibacillus daejeonensis]